MLQQGGASRAEAAAAPPGRRTIEQWRLCVARGNAGARIMNEVQKQQEEFLRNVFRDRDQDGGRRLGGGANPSVRC